MTNFKAKRLSFASYADTSTDVQVGDNITGLNMKGGYKNLAAPGSTGDYAKLGMSRRSSSYRWSRARRRCRISPAC